MTEVRGKRVLVVGLGRSGRAAAQCFCRRGAVVTVTDLRPPWAFQGELRKLMAQKVGLELGLHREETFLQQDLIVVSPGVPADLPQLEAARQSNIPVIPEIEAAGWFLESPLVGITGSNGKTTTTALVGKMLEASGFPTFVGGNIGVPLISAVDEVLPDSIVVAELSSFQLEIIRDFCPHVAVLLNLTPNHLDRHPSFDAYVRAKAQIFRNQKADDYAILNADDPTVMSLAPEIPSRRVFFSRKRNLPDGILVSNGHILYRVGNLERLLLETREVPLRGDFNLENVLVAAATACVLGADFAALRRAVREFRGVEHRLEYVREIRGVEFFNDSKATSVDATVNALRAFERGVHLILGGKDKGAPYAPIRPLLEGRVRYLYLIGAAAGRIAKELSGAAEQIRTGDLETAVRQAFKLAVPGDVILLSPACASFDQFQDFEHRGRVFKELIEHLAREVENAHVARRQAEPAESSAFPAVVGTLSRPRPETAPAFSGVPEISPRPDTRPESDVQAPEVSELRKEPSPTGDEPRTPETPPAELAGAEAFASGPTAGEVGAELMPAEVKEIAASSPATVEPPTAREPAALPAPALKRLELLYVYEVGAEEVAYLETESAFPEEDFEASAPALRPSEGVEDEALPFEVRATAAGAPTDDSRGAERPGGESQEDGAGGAEPESSPKKPRRQPRLPGI